MVNTQEVQSLWSLEGDSSQARIANVEIHTGTYEHPALFASAFSLFHVIFWIQVILPALSTQFDIGDWPKKKQTNKQKWTKKQIGC